MYNVNTSSLSIFLSLYHFVSIFLSFLFLLSNKIYYNLITNTVRMMSEKLHSSEKVRCSLQLVSTSLQLSAFLQVTVALLAGPLLGDPLKDSEGVWDWLFIFLQNALPKQMYRDRDRDGDRAL
jgi:hypothetical protein